MKFKQFYEVRDGRGKLRFSSVYRIEAEFFFKRIIRNSPVIIEVKR